MLKVRGLVSGYGKTPILRDLGVGVGKGEIVAILGRNGVGKTTFMKTAIGLVRAMSGEVILDRRNVTALPAHERARLGMGYIPQGRGVFPDMTVLDNLRMGELINQKVRAKSLDLVYGYFPRLRERSHQKAGTLSGGEQSMLALGRALVGQPDLLLLDEPSEGVQPNIVQQVAEIIGRINRELGLTVLFVEQNMELVQAMAQRGYVMDKGRIVAELSAVQLRNPALVQQFLAV